MRKRTKEYQKEIKEDTEDFLMGAVDQLSYSDFKDYKSDMLDWTSGNVFGQ